MTLTRENIRNGKIRRMIREHAPDVKMLSNAEIRASWGGMLERGDLSRGVWVFAYGSLIWNPAFHHVERRLGKIHGYHRRFNIWTALGRGTEEKPGLLLGLDRGGSCKGVAFKVKPESVEEELDIIWKREMITGVYAPIWVNVDTEQGMLPAITFAADKTHDRYAGTLDIERIASAIAIAEGPIGHCADYLSSTVEHLDTLGIRDSRLHRLDALVSARRNRLQK